MALEYDHLDEMLEPAEDSTPSLTGAAGRPAKRRHRHEWCRSCVEFGVASHCLVTGCGIFQDDPRLRRGKRSRRLGGDQERRIERVYGPRKVGEFGDAIDHLGVVWKWQSKATRSLPPVWLSVIDKPTYRESAPAMIDAALRGMDALRFDLMPVVIRTFVRNGGRAEGRTRDWLFVRAGNFESQTGQLADPSFGYVVIPGDWWLDHFGRDEPA